MPKDFIFNELIQAKKASLTPQQKITKRNSFTPIYSYLNVPTTPLFTDEVESAPLVQEEGDEGRSPTPKSGDTEEIPNQADSKVVDTGKISSEISNKETKQGTAKGADTVPSQPVDTKKNNHEISTEYLYINTPGELKEKVAPYLKAEVLGVDIETTGLDPYQSRIRLVSIATPGEPTLVIDCFEVDVQELTPLLTTKEAVKVFHNGVFDYKFLLYSGVEVEGKLFDTMLAYQLLHLGKDKVKSSLKELTKIYLGIELDKTEQKGDWGTDNLTPEQLKYSALDAAVLLPLRDKLKLALIGLKLQETAKLEFDCLKVTAHMELNGMLLDADKWAKEITQKLDVEKAEAKESLRNLLPNSPEDLNPSSGSQMLQALKGLGLNITSTSESTLLKHLDEQPEIINSLLSYRKINKGLTTYGTPYLKYLNPVTGRIHSTFWQLKSTGRYSSSAPNIQQIPRESVYRSSFIPAPGHKLIQCDYGQIELRIAAEIYDEPKMLKAFKEEADIHKLTASAIYNVPPEQVSKEQRSIAKTANFGILYGISPTKLQETCLKGGVVVSLDDAKHIIDSFFKLYQGIDRARNESYKAAIGVKTTTIRTRGGRLMNLGHGGKYIPNQFMNYPIQGLCADITKLALVKLLSALKPYGCKAKIIAMIHDEILVEAKEEIAPEVRDLLATAMREAAEKYLKKVPIEVDAKICDSWADK